MLLFIEVLRTIAVLLIFNSHLKGVYPTDILSFGGGFGLALFYMLSGYLLSGINQKTRFFKWYSKRIIRLYIPLVIFEVIKFIFGFTKITCFQDFFKAFIFPTYWFVASMIILYAVYYLFVKYIYNRYGKKAISTILVICFTLFLIFYISRSPLGLFSLQSLKVSDVFSVESPYLISQLIWFSSMLVGLSVKNTDFFRTNVLKQKTLCFLGVVICSLIFFVVRIFGKIDIDLEFLLPFSYIGFAYFIFGFIKLFENGLQNARGTPVFKLIKIISKSSLEIYYVQFVFIVLFKEFIFPLNFALILVAAILTAVLLHFVSEKCNNIIFCRKKGVVLGE